MIEELEDALMEAAKKLGESREVNPEVWKGMLGRQFLAVASSVSCRMMSGEITLEIIREENRRSLLIERGLRDGLIGKPKRNDDSDYLTGYGRGNEYRTNKEGPLSEPRNIGLY